MRLDKGTETGIMATMHAFLRKSHIDVTDASDTVIYGKSTSNQIERWWKELHERLEKYFKRQLMSLKDLGHYNPDIALDRDILAFVYIPVLEKEMKVFVDNWNTHRIRYQRGTYLPNGIPNHIYNFPENYGLEKCGQHITDSQLKEVCEVSGVLDVRTDFLLSSQRKTLQEYIPNPHLLSANECTDAYLFLRRKLVSQLTKEPVIP
ncbi:uncharacterized protein LOC144745874 [Ciona intestinalis]